MKKIIITFIGLTAFAQAIQALPIVGQKPANGLNKTAAGCNATTATIDLDVNNVRARLMNGGDMWWDIPSSTAQYEVPRGSKKNSLFSGSIWIGGVESITKDIRVAAQTYRQSGNDYWSGPLDPNSGEITFETCAEWDRFWKINAADINTFRSLTLGQDPTQVCDIISNNQDKIAKVIKEWPAQGNTEVYGAGGALMQNMPNRPMAEYVDVDGVPGYNWRCGDYPKISGDQYIWWIFNDKGDIKLSTQSEAINVEIHASAFAFSTNDCLNDATFYNYKVYNYSNFTLDSCYMATWSDADLGAAFDDFVGCDTARGLGILYNGDAFDDGAAGYGYDIPMVGVDYFQGPKYTDPNNPLNKIELKMSVFTYYNNGGGATQGDPQTKDDFYGYMTGTWRDGTNFTTACNAYGSGTPTKVIFTGDPCKGGWSEVSCANTPNDRRFVHSAGPFQLKPGDEPNNITIGAVWVPSVGGGSSACFSKIQICDDRAQKLFDNEFKLPTGPNAPSVFVQPLDNKLVFNLDNLVSSNNYKEGYGRNLSEEKYREIAKKFAKTSNNPDSLYKFEGYVVYQLKNATVSISSLRNKDGSINTENARKVFQCDIKNGVKDILNFEVDPEVSSDYYIPRNMVQGADTGIAHTFQLTQDAFATGTSKGLVNYKTYYYIALAYAHNDFSAPQEFDKAKVDSIQDIRYLESRTDGKGLPVKVITAIPHPASDNLYVQTYADYGTGIQLKRIEGLGNSGITMSMTQESEMEALQAPNYHSYNPTYKPNAGPMKISVVNPDSIKPGDYEVWFDVKKSYQAPFLFDPITSFRPDTNSGAFPDSSTWFIRNIATGDTVYSDGSLATFNEKYLRKYGAFDWGISASAQQQVRPGDMPREGENGLISSTVIYDDINKFWFLGVKDEDGKSFNNWIRSGIESSAPADPDYPCNQLDWDNSVDATTNKPVINNRDPNGKYENVVNGTFAPYNLVSTENSNQCGFGLMYGSGQSDHANNRLQEVDGVDLVFTSDKSLWSRCPVIEMTDNASTAVSQNGAFKYNRRNHDGWNGNVDANGKPVYSTDANDYGMSYFPGYAINIETGERLNVAFGEESFNLTDNGGDMLFNPTSRLTDPISGAIKWGGKHVIYIMRSKYDGGEALKTAISFPTNSPSNNGYRNEYKKMMWVGVPALFEGSKLASVKDGLIPTRTRVQLRVTRPYAKYLPNPGVAARNNGWPLYTFSTKDLAPAALGDVRNAYTDNKQDIFDRIHVVPNPYYAVSEYENNRLDTRVKIINLPEKATIKIYTVDGALVKTIEKSDNKSNFVDWDIKNNKGIPIASGMYLVHVSIPNVGETILKWFGAMRPVDITSF